MRIIADFFRFHIEIIGKLEAYAGSDLLDAWLMATFFVGILLLLEGYLIYQVSRVLVNYSVTAIRRASNKRILRERLEMIRRNHQYDKSYGPILKV